MKGNKVMYVLKEPRERTNGQNGEKKTFWNQIGVMFGKEDDNDAFDVVLDSHPIGDRLRAFKVKSQTQEPSS